MHVIALICHLYIWAHMVLLDGGPCCSLHALIPSTDSPGKCRAKGRRWHSKQKKAVNLSQNLLSGPPPPPHGLLSVDEPARLSSLSGGRSFVTMWLTVVLIREVWLAQNIWFQ